MIIPIGTKSSLALKPAVTITLIGLNCLMAAITIPLMMRSQSELIEIQSKRFALELRLYLDDHPFDTYLGGGSIRAIEEAVNDVERSQNQQQLEAALFTALGMIGLNDKDLLSYEEMLASRTTVYYFYREGEGKDLWNSWKNCREREAGVAEGSVLRSFGLVPSEMFRTHTFFTHLFLHAGLWHLLGNMLFLWVVGCLLEDTWGRFPFLLFYLGGGVIAGLAHCYQDTSSAVPLVGASGAIAAAMGAFAVRHFMTKIKLFYFFILVFKPVWGTFYCPAFVFLPLWFFEQVALKYVTDQIGSSGVAYGAHVGGFGAGVLTALLFRLTGFEQRVLAPKVQRTQIDAGVTKDPRFTKACELLEAGKLESGKVLFGKLLAERPEDLALIQDVAVMYREKGLIKEYGTLTDKALRLLLLKNRYEEAAELGLDVARTGSPVEINPQYLMRIGKWLAERDRYGDAHDVYRSIIGQRQVPLVSVKAAIALARLLNDRMNNPRDALATLSEARALQLDQEWLDCLIAIESEIKRSIPEPLEV